MNLAILGGTGRTGQHLITLALQRGHNVRVLARDPSKIKRQHERLSIIPGDARDMNAIARLLEHSDAVLSALGPTPGTSSDTMTSAAQHLVTLLPSHGIRRLITLTGAGVSHPGDQPKLIDHVIRTLLKLTQPTILNDSTTHANLIRASTLDWTIVRVPRLTDGILKPVHAGSVGTIKPFVTRASVARFMLDQLDSDAFIQNAPAISN
ncbi:NAD(P)-dependent oxidoreductase [Deinococcus peraridilitoris]|uniref:Putative NADH-flavin reductase n=1 Tax=Deinococcus peraridilitoris (strain DSM 19664 / LMG 22246 / CIP 109416 / KR-200) TaxID=937777 RepID=L0A5N6_DEIPD|nr:NAD(P)H-binding protein [Deinococcus peraridilitoris]AFZ69193.1 putative NADH-flavin reductase [Deinococcus peraridilitoris DSM 19664]